MKATKKLRYFHHFTFREELGTMSKVRECWECLISVVLGYFVILPLGVIYLIVNEGIRAVLKIFLYCSRSNLELVGKGLDAFFPPTTGIQGGIILSVLATQCKTEINLDK